MRDKWGDEISLYTDGFGAILYCRGSSGDLTYMSLTPKQAKKLAKELLKASKGVKAVQL